MTPITFVFDLDGTLVDTAPDLVGALNVALAMEDLAPLTVSELRPLVGGGVRVMVERGLKVRARSVTPKRFDELVAAVFAHYELHIADESVLYPGVAGVLEELSGQGHVLSVCTNKTEKLSNLLLDALDLRSRFVAVCGADTFPVKKPDALHLIGTIERSGGDRSRAVMIGDSRADRETARNARVPCILLDYGYADVPAKDLAPEAVLSRFQDVPDTARRLVG